MRATHFFTFVVVATLTVSAVHAQQTARITAANTGYLEYLPKDYNNNLDKYPIVLFLHGIGEKGTSSTDPDDITASLAKVANVALPKYIKYGAQYPFIVISPQLKSSYSRWTAGYVIEVLNHVKKYLRIDESRIYLTGLSLGGYGVWTTVAAYPRTFAAIAPICSGGNALSQACTIAAENVPIWGFHGDSDGVVSYQVTLKMINAVNSCTPKPDPLAKITIFPGAGHNIWDKVYKETSVLTWMQGYRKGTDSGSEPAPTPTEENAAPIANAGADKTITLPANATSITGTGTDSDGTVNWYAWWQVSGPSEATLENRAKPVVTVSNLVEGTYTFRLKVTDNDQAKGFDDVKVTVKSGTTSNATPAVSAGADKTLTLPSNSVYLNGSASDTDGNIASWHWSKISGPSASMSGTTSATMRAYNLVAGTYTFRLTATDNDGASRSDDVIVTVKSATTNAYPVVSAGSDKTLTLPSNSVYLNGSASDSDGNIASWRWSKISGPAASISGTTTATMRAYNLIAGTYTFRLTATDNDGASRSDDVIVTVMESFSTTNTLPVANAGSDRHITLPTNSVVLNGSGSDEDGSVVQYSWRKAAGPAATLSNSNTADLKLTNLVEGTYYFVLTVKDDKGASDSDKMMVKVYPGSL